MLASEYILIDIAFISFALPAMTCPSCTNTTGLWNLPAGLASPKLRKGAADRYTISFLSLISNSFWAAVTQEKASYVGRHLAKNIPEQNLFHFPSNIRSK